jgi:hypothetical protein
MADRRPYDIDISRKNGAPLAQRKSTRLRSRARRFDSCRGTSAKT